jgi:hypothetical protein
LILPAVAVVEVKICKGMCVCMVISVVQNN